MINRTVGILPLQGVTHTLGELEVLISIVPQDLCAESIPLPQRKVCAEAYLMRETRVGTQIIRIPRGEGCSLPFTSVTEGIGDVGAAIPRAKVHSRGELLRDEVLVCPDSTGEALDAFLRNRLTLDVEDRGSHTAILHTRLTDELNTRELADRHALQ